MFSRLILTLAVLITPSLAWACSGLVLVQPLDFILLGATAGVTYRLLFQWALKWSEDIHSAVYLGLLIASYGVGVLAAGEISVFPGFFTLPAVLLAFLGAVYPKNTIARVALLAPVLVLSASGSLIVLLAHQNSHNSPHHPDFYESQGF